MKAIITTPRTAITTTTMIQTAIAFMPMKPASMTIPPVPQNGSNTVPPFFTPVRLINALA